MKVGIIGGGQLGMMLTEAAQKMPEEISEVIVLDPTPDCPAAKVGAAQIPAGFKDESAIRELARKVDVLTYEIESGDSVVLQAVSSETQVNPSPETLRIIQDKFIQKSFLAENDIPVSDFMRVESLEDLKSAIRRFDLPVLLKARRDAYDGRGNYKISRPGDVVRAYEYFDNRGVFVERFVDFDLEVSIIAARNTQGEIKTYPLVENIHKDNILKITIAPGRVSKDIADKAEALAEKTMKVLRGAGVFGIEMFVKGDDIMINEIAPRVHNSGHYTLDSCSTSQFEQHLRAILGMRLGDTTLKHKTIMYNILGPDEFTGEYKPVKVDVDNTYLKMYGKKQSKPQRKLGHFNLVDVDNKPIDELLETAKKIGSSIKIEPVS